MLCLDSFSLCRYVDEFDIDTTDNVIHKHIPFAVLLIKIAQDWKRAHNGKLPANVRELKAAITARRRVEEDEDNYTEALKSAYVVLFPPEISKLSSLTFSFSISNYMS
jgi:amyloid beta precursor protein binding protein 1